MHEGFVPRLTPGPRLFFRNSKTLGDHGKLGPDFNPFVTRKKPFPLSPYIMLYGTRISPKYDLSLIIPISTPEKELLPQVFL
jgi:hypothetical protein